MGHAWDKVAYWVSEVNHENVSELNELQIPT